jgi:hypothetical protein
LHESAQRDCDKIEYALVRLFFRKNKKIYSPEAEWSQKARGPSGLAGRLRSWLPIFRLIEAAMISPQFIRNPVGSVCV